MLKAALLLIDVQKGFDSPLWGQRNNPDAESNIATLLAEWRKHDAPIIHVKHCSVSPQSPLHPDQPGNAFKDEASPIPGEPEFSARKKRLKEGIVISEEIWNELENTATGLGVERLN